MGHLAHPAAGLGTPAANFGAGLHFIAVKGIARHGASFTDLGTGSTFGGVMTGSAHHEIGCRLAGLDTIIHQHRMVMRHMRAALIQAMIIEGVLAGIATLPAHFDADSDIFGMRSHGTAPLVETGPY